mgnify:FL=1
MPIDYRRTCFYFIRAVLFTPEHIRLRAGARFQSASANLSLITALVTTELSFSLSRHAGRNTTFDGYVSASKLCNLLFSSLVDWPDVASGTDSLIPPRFRMSSQSGASSSFREIPIPTRKIPVCSAVSTTFARQSRSILPSWALEPAKLGLSCLFRATSDFDFSIFPTSAVGFLLGHVFSLSSQFNRYGCRPRRSSHERSLASDQLSLFCLQEHQATWTRPVP